MCENHHIVLEERYQQFCDARAAVRHGVFRKVERERDKVALVLLKVLVSVSHTPPAQFLVVTNRMKRSRPAVAGIGFSRLALSSSLARLMLSISSDVVSAGDLLISSAMA